MKKSVLPVLLLFTFPLIAQLNQSLSTRSMALSNQSVVFSTPFNASGNPALLAENKKIEFGASLANTFFLAALKQGAFGGALQISGKDAVGLVVQFDGTQYLKNTTIHLGYAKKLNEKCFGGISIIYLLTHKETIGQTHRITAKAAMVYKPVKSILIATELYNPFLKINNNKENDGITTVLSTAIKYKVSAQVNLFAEYRLDLQKINNIKFGMSYMPAKELIIYLGFQNQNAPLSFGCVVKKKELHICFAFQYHQKLGFSPATGFEYISENSIQR